MSYEILLRAVSYTDEVGDFTFTRTGMLSWVDGRLGRLNEKSDRPPKAQYKARAPVLRP